MDYQVIWTDPAREDLEQIWHYIAQDNPSAADRLKQQIFQRTLQLHSLPHSGQRFPQPSRGDVRQLVVGNYRIFYQVLDFRQVVEILTVRHAARRDPKF